MWTLVAWIRLLRSSETLKHHFDTVSRVVTHTNRVHPVSPQSPFNKGAGAFKQVFIAKGWTFGLKSQLLRQFVLGNEWKVEHLHRHGNWWTPLNRRRSRDVIKGPSIDLEVWLFWFQVSSLQYVFTTSRLMEYSTTLWCFYFQLREEEFEWITSETLRTQRDPLGRTAISTVRLSSAGAFELSFSCCSLKAFVQLVFYTVSTLIYIILSSYTVLYWHWSVLEFV